jgi:hypothetical protein
LFLDPNMDDVVWRQTAPTKPLTDGEYRQLQQSFAPRIRPYNFYVYMDSQIHEMAPTEYLIGYSNELTAIGVATDLDNIGNRVSTLG